MTIERERSPAPCAPPRSSPRSQRLPCAARPRVTRRAPTRSPCARAPAGPRSASVRMHASARWRSTNAWAPRLAYSSSATSARSSRPGKPSFAAAAATAIHAATPPFSVVAPTTEEPIARDTPARTARSSPAVPTVSRCAHSTTRWDPGRRRPLATTHWDARARPPPSTLARRALPATRRRTRRSPPRREPRRGRASGSRKARARAARQLADLGSRGNHGAQICIQTARRTQARIEERRARCGRPRYQIESHRARMPRRPRARPAGDSASSSSARRGGRRRQRCIAHAVIGAERVARAWLRGRGRGSGSLRVGSPISLSPRSTERRA